MAGSPRNSLGNVRYDMDITYPEHLSRLNRHLVQEHSKPHTKSRRNNRPRNRYRTQPVTFDEIQEVDEESGIIDNTDSDTDQISTSLSAKFELDFYRMSKTFGSKLMKPRASDPAIMPGQNALEKSNGEPPLQSKPLEQLRWTDHSREGSI